MPSLSPTNYKLLELQDKDLIKFTRAQNSLSWRGQLTAEQYVEREFVCGKGRMTSQKVIVFMLVNEDDPEQRVGSIELLIRKGLRYDNDDENHKVLENDILCGTIGSVFTYPEHRGRGVGQIMVNKLIEIAKSKYLGPKGFIFLYSEVGEYYTRNGFKSYEVPLAKFPLGKKMNYNPESSDNLNYEYIKYKNFINLLDLYNRQFRTDLIDKVKEDGKTRVSINPSEDYIDWFHLRAKYLASKIFDKASDMSLLSYDEIIDKFQKIEPSIFGIKVSKDSEVVGGIIWTYEWSRNKVTKENENTVTVLKIIVDKKYSTEEVSKQLILRMKSYLESSTTVPSLKNFQQVVIWQSDLNSSLCQWIEGNLDGKINQTNSSLSAILLNNDVDKEKLLNDDLIWEGNDKLPWW
ncbi:hypothetical protein CAAN1_12S00958 [[Candida] anglica]|uniref:N-acetyltransferase domain-containing protein n=1 Tax=[Candida] anglica TaxID=148631 RepID=A0ABP0E926_9ASCO